jgi:hypothetical protein
MGGSGGLHYMQPRKEQQTIRHAEECLAKAAYCAWVAQISGDPEIRRYLEGLARRWSQEAAVEALPDQ